MSCRQQGLAVDQSNPNLNKRGLWYANYVPIDEAHPLKGQSPYSASKIGADQIAYSFFASFDLPVTILRPFNVYGPRQSARAIIPSIITQILNGKDVIELGLCFQHVTLRLSLIPCVVL